MNAVRLVKPGEHPVPAIPFGAMAVAALAVTVTGALALGLLAGFVYAVVTGA